MSGGRYAIRLIAPDVLLPTRFHTALAAKGSARSYGREDVDWEIVRA